MADVLQHAAAALQRSIFVTPALIKLSPVRHARAQNVSVDLVLLENEVQLTVEDDGTGFDPIDPRLKPHGISVMGERVLPSSTPAP